MPLFTGDEFTPLLDDLTVGLSQMLFPIVVLLGLNGLVVGILNAYDHFTIAGDRAAGLEPRDHRRADRPDARCSRATTSSTPTRSASWSARSCSC